MPKETKDAKIAVLTCAFEPPKPKTKHKLEIKTVEDYEKLQKAEHKYFTDMVDMVKKSGANFVICQWGFDDEANHLLLHHSLPSVRWVGGMELEMIAIATGARIVPRFEELSASKLGRAQSVKEITKGTMNDKMIVIEGGAKSGTVTILVRGGNDMVVKEAERSIHDAICGVRNLIRDSRILPGGGACELAASAAIAAGAETTQSIQQYAVRAFADAIVCLPEALADNSGLDAILAIADAKAQQAETGNRNIGIDCMNMGTTDMLAQHVYESFTSKHNQIELATQVVKMILKIDDVIVPSEVA
eukprot:GHVT01048951.1.p1 GENE.GHVT01048951.1~~GHVT01048951.1.p1  ORF type:complete len:303 (+),score=76.04 GHVT01048951.1:203-1111(+)